jgi:hypothetical protein
MEDLIAAVPGTTYIKNPLGESLTDIKISVNTGKAGIYGVLPSEAARTVRTVARRHPGRHVPRQ